MRAHIVWDGLRKTCGIGMVGMLLVSCVSFANRPDSTALNPQEGILVFRGTAKTELQLYVAPYGESTPPAAAKSNSAKGFQLEAGTHLYVKALPAGEYTWSKFSNGYASFLFPANGNHFVIAAGKVNYVGDLVVSYQERTLKVQQETETVVKELAKDYPKTARAFPLVVSLTTFR